MTDVLASAAVAVLHGESEFARDERFAAMVRAHTRFAFRVAFAAVRNAADAEDAVQEAFLKIYRSRAWHAIEDERAFLARAVWRVAVSRRGKHIAEPLADTLPDRGSSPERAAIDASTEAMLHALIDALPENLRQPLALSALEELDSPTIAGVLGIPEGTVRRRIGEARALLKRKIESRMERRNG